MTSKVVHCILMFLLSGIANHAFAEDNSTDTAFIEENWLVRERADHPDHDNHVFVTEMSGRLVDAMVKKKALRGFDMLIVMQCGHGRRSMAHFAHLVQCFRTTKLDIMELVENYMTKRPEMNVRDHVAVTTLCGVMPKIIQCKMELDNSIKDCEQYSGKLELVNDMHTLLVDNYCVHDGQRLLEVMSKTAPECARQMMKTIQICWGKSGLNYNDFSEVLRRLTQKQKLCQQLVGTQKCLAKEYYAHEACRGALSDMVSEISAKIEQEFTCNRHSAVGRDLLGF